MKYKWYFCDAVKGIEDSYSEAKAELNKHLDFDIETEGEYKSESSGFGIGNDPPIAWEVTCLSLVSGYGRLSTELITIAKLVSWTS